MLRLHARTAVTVSAISVLAVGGVLALAGPAAAVAVDPSPIGGFSWDLPLGQEANAMTVTPGGTEWMTVNGPGGDSVIAFAPGASGTAAPEFDISGTTSGVNYPLGVAVDGSGNIWVADQDAVAVFEFAAGSTGDVAPSTALTDLGGDPQGVAIGSDGAIYVTTPDDVDIFAPHASGADAPTRIITGLSNASGIAVQPDGAIVVAENSGTNAVIATFAANASGAATPIYQISGSNTQFDPNFPVNVALDSSGEIYIGNGENVVEFAQNANGNVAPLTTLAGTNSGVNNVAAVGVGSNGDVYVEQFGNATSIFGPLLTVTSVSPATGPLNGGQTVTISGSSFLGAPIGVSFGGVAATRVQLVNATTLTAVVPAGVAEGTVGILVTENGGAQSSTLDAAYTYGPASRLPTTGVDPTAGTVGGAVLLGIGGILLIVRRRLAHRSRTRVQA